MGSLEIFNLVVAGLCPLIRVLVDALIGGFPTALEGEQNKARQPIRLADRSVHQVERVGAWSPVTTQVAKGVLLWQFAQIWAGQIAVVASSPSTVNGPLHYSKSR